MEAGLEHRGGVVRHPERERMEASGLKHRGGVVRMCVREREKERDKI